MDSDKCRPVDDDLRVAVASLELEISDSILKNLLAALADRRKDETNSHATNLLLQSIDSIARHINTLRVKSDPRAFNLIDELWSAYVEITLNLAGDENFTLALAKTQDVLDWQQQCLVDTLEKSAHNASLPSPAVAELVQEQISKTDNFVRHEIAAIKSLAEMATFSPGQPVQFSAAMTDEIHDLQELFQQEISKLRFEIRIDPDQSSPK
jgi:hypothetical protein